MCINTSMISAVKCLLNLILKLVVAMAAVNTVAGPGLNLIDPRLNSWLPGPVVGFDSYCEPNQWLQFVQIKCRPMASSAAVN
ncbi:hypothetical protein VNO77_27621 [Canavalia gladiata]|uniref:Secreted protein n=1 Tax=Canavalia gladiata TaxID=3824 RepID=A0AAN9KY68_CANGL